MMVMRCKVGQSFSLGDDIRVMIQEVKHGRIVRFGIQAPAEIPVHRLEIFQLIQDENREASIKNPQHWFTGE